MDFDVRAFGEKAWAWLPLIGYVLSSANMVTGGLIGSVVGGLVWGLRGPLWWLVKQAGWYGTWIFHTPFRAYRARAKASEDRLVAMMRQFAREAADGCQCGDNEVCDQCCGGKLTDAKGHPASGCVGHLPSAWMSCPSCSAAVAREAAAKAGRATASAEEADVCRQCGTERMGGLYPYCPACAKTPAKGGV